MSRDTPRVVLAGLLFLLSGATAMVIIIKRSAFMRLEDERQLAIVFIIWFVHVGAFAVLMGFVFL